MKDLLRPVLLIALGGNALIRKGEKGSVAQQFKNLVLPIRQIARLSQDYRVIITHGNGPQVGNLLLQQESCAEVPKLPLEILVAQTQGQIGYMIESTLDSQLMDLGVHIKPLISLITYVVVHEDDPAFSHPTKPIGPVYKSEKDVPSGYPIVKTAKGLRRVVVSPKPVTIIEKREIKKLINSDFIVICCGGGGIPVVREGRAFQGVDAVIDKDLASAKLAEEVGVDIFVIATDVDGVALNYGTAEEVFLRDLNVQSAAQLIAEGHFAAGSMRPKVEAAVQFVHNGGKRAVITSIEAIGSAVNREAGTEITL
ncbi:MAG: carbamate kinase [Desulfobacterales bacterium]|nr:carbamate kinase [Desulfobacterales bacterium]